MKLPKTYTPDQVADILQLSKNTVYKLINRGEIKAKKYGNVYRVPARALSFIYTGLDNDLYQAELVDSKKIKEVHQQLQQVRKKLWG